MPQVSLECMQKCLQLNYIINGSIKSYSLITENDLLPQIYAFVQKKKILHWMHTVLDVAKLSLILSRCLSEIPNESYMKSPFSAVVFNIIFII